MITSRRKSRAILATGFREGIAIRSTRAGIPAKAGIETFSSRRPSPGIPVPRVWWIAELQVEVIPRRMFLKQERPSGHPPTLEKTWRKLLFVIHLDGLPLTRVNTGFIERRK